MTYRAKEVYKNRETALQYDRERFHNMRGHWVDRREKNLILRAIRKTGLKPPATLLDLPCGTGRLTLFLAQKGFNVQGMDISEQMLRRAATKMGSYLDEGRVKLSTGDAESIAFEDNTFDIVVSLRLFGHLPPEVRKGVLEEMKRVSRSFLIVAYYHKHSLRGFMRNRRRARGKESWNPVALREIDEELKSTGLRKIGVFPLLFGVSETLVVLAGID